MMEFGLALDLTNAESVPDQVDQRRGLLRAVEQAGFSSLWLGESYHTRREPAHSPSVLLNLSFMASQTDLQLGAGVLLMRGYDPRRLAIDVAQLDRISGGRLILGLGLGRTELSDLLGVAPMAGRDIERFIKHLRSSWAVYDERGGAHLASDYEGGLGVLGRSAQNGGPRIFVGGGVKAASERAALVGDGYYAATNYSDEALKLQAQHYHSYLAEGATGEVVVNRVCLIRESEREAQLLATEYFGDVVAYYAARNAWPTSSGDNNVHPLVGTPEMVGEQLARYNEWGVTAVQLRLAPYGMPTEVAAETVDLFATQIMPGVQTRLSLRGQEDE